MNVQPFIPKSDSNIIHASTNFPNFYNKFSQITGTPFQDSPISISLYLIQKSPI
jgi:hypothetical protein